MHCAVVSVILEELAQLGRTRWRRRGHVLAYFDHHASNGPPKSSTAAWKDRAATPSDSATSPTTDCAHYFTAATSLNESMHSDSGSATLISITVESSGHEADRREVMSVSSFTSTGDVPRCAVGRGAAWRDSAGAGQAHHSEKLEGRRRSPARRRP
jgi:hypothetical protein